MRILSADLVNAHALADFVHEHQSCVRIRLNFESACKLRIYSMRDQQTRIVRMRVIFFCSLLKTHIWSYIQHHGVQSYFGYEEICMGCLYLDQNYPVVVKSLDSYTRILWMRHWLVKRGIKKASNSTFVILGMHYINISYLGHFHYIRWVWI